MTDTNSEDLELIPIRSDERRRLLPVGLTSLYAEVSAGRLQIVKIGARSFIRRGELRRYLTELPVVGRTNG